MYMYFSMLLMKVVACIKLSNTCTLSSVYVHLHVYIYNMHMYMYMCTFTTCTCTCTCILYMYMYTVHVHVYCTCTCILYMYMYTVHVHVYCTCTCMQLQVYVCKGVLSSCSGLVALHNACSYGHLEVAELLIQHGANVNAVDVWKYTPLHEAASKGKYDICRLLLRVRLGTGVRWLVG